MHSTLASLASSNSPDHNAKGTQSVVTQARAQAQPPTACGHVVSGTLSLPAQGCFSPVPHGTRPLSVTREYSRLRGWSPQLHARFLGSGATQEHRYERSVVFAYRAVTVSGAPFQGTSADFSPRVRGSYNPAWHARRFRQSARSARRYSGPRCCFLFLPVLRCFSSQGSPPP